MVKNSEIIAIFNLNHPLSSIYEEYVQKHRQDYKIVNLTDGIPAASLILTCDTLYLSAISAFTLKKRATWDLTESASYTNL